VDKQPSHSSEAWNPAQMKWSSLRQTCCVSWLLKRGRQRQPVGERSVVVSTLAAGSFLYALGQKALWIRMQKLHQVQMVVWQ